MKGIYKRTEYPTAARSARKKLGPPPQERIDKETLQGILSAGGLTKQTNRMLGRLIAEEKLWDEAMEARPLGRGTGGFPLGMGTRMGLHVWMHTP